MRSPLFFVLFHLKMQSFLSLLQKSCILYLALPSGRDLSWPSRTNALFEQSVSPFPSLPGFHNPLLSSGQVNQSSHSPLSNGIAAVMDGCHWGVIGRKLSSFLSCELVFKTTWFPLAFGIGAWAELVQEPWYKPLQVYVLFSSLSMISRYKCVFSTFSNTVQVMNSLNQVSLWDRLCKSQRAALRPFLWPESPAAHQEYKCRSVTPLVNCRYIGKMWADGVMNSVLSRVLIVRLVVLKREKEPVELKTPVILSQPRNASCHSLTLLLWRANDLSVI